MKITQRFLQRFYGKLKIGMGLCCVLGLLYSCQAGHQLGMESGETHEATSEAPRSDIAKWLPQVRQDPQNEERAYCEVPHLSGSNVPEVNIASAMSMARVVQQSRGIQSILVTNYTHLQENRDNEVQYLETKCSRIFGSIDNLRRYQNCVLVGINQAPPSTRLDEMRTWFRQVGSPTMRILANRICLYDPLNQDTDNPDFWSTVRFKEEIARIPHIPKAMAANLYRSMLGDNDKVVLQQCLDHQVTEISNAITRNDYATISQYWDFIKKARTVYPQAVVVLSAPELLSIKLNKPTVELDTVDKAAIVHYCAELGDQSASAYIDKDAIAILGETGSGKSTATNYWMGCDMQCTPDEFDVEDIIGVHPDSAQPEATSIGHGRVSHTLMPQMVQDPNRATRIYVDCPGFSDNRGAEINIANAINIRKGLQQARSVKVVCLISYPSLHTGRGESVRDLAKMCEQLFGSVDNLRAHQASILLGINRAPAQASTDRVRRWLTGMNSPAVQILGQRMFLYDPLDQGGAAFWSRDRFLAEIEQMPAIPQQVSSNMFQTVLTNNDKAMLRDISEYQVNIMRAALEQEDYTTVDRCWGPLNQLQIIGHRRVAELMEEEVRPHIQVYTEERVAAFNRYAVAHRFTEAEQILATLRALHAHFPGEDLVDLEDLVATLQAARTQYTAQQEAEDRQRKAEEAQEAEGRRQQEAGARQRAEAETRQRAEAEAQRTEAERRKTRREREEMEARVRRQEAALEEERRKRRNNRIIGGVATAAGVVGAAVGPVTIGGNDGEGGGVGISVRCSIM